MIYNNNYHNKNKENSFLYPKFGNNKTVSSYVLDSNDINFKCDFNEIKISIASKNDIYSWSKGLIQKTDTLNYKTLKPEKGGIFCTSIFGPTEDYKCVCGRYIGISYNGLRCERCNVLVGSRRLRRLNFGHIELNTWIVHPWFYSYICIILQMTKKTFLSILEFDDFIFVKDSYDEKFKKYTIVSSSDYYEELFVYDELIGGGEAIYHLINTYNYKAEYDEIQEMFKDKKLDDVSDKDLKRREILQLVNENKINIRDMLISVLPVIPADIRPILYLEGGGIASLDINETYRKIISRVERLSKLKDMETHRIIINNEKYMVNQAICQLLGPCKSKTKSISEYIKGKKGYFRRALLGKRTDFSCRSAIVVGPDLNIDECGLPIDIAKELFKPFAYSIILRREIANSIVEAKKIFENDHEQACKILHEIVQDFPIILNRAPTLHRLGLQAFKIKLHKSSAIRIPPLVCAGYNADFDGDNMSGYLPITLEARVECYSLMMSTNNIFLPSSGKLILLPSKDIVLGLYYMTLLDKVTETYKYIIYSICELNNLLILNKISAHTRIKFYIQDITGTNIHITSYARLEMWSLLKKYYDVVQLKFSIFNQDHDKNTISNTVMYVFYNCGKENVLHFLNFITQRGFYYLTKSGITYSPDDMLTVPDQKEKENIVLQEIKQMNQHYDQGLITNEELNANIMSTWGKYIEEMGDSIIDVMNNSKLNFEDINNIMGNNIYLMYISGARGSKSQIQQMCCLRGFMAKPSGEISNFIIRSSLKKGLGVLEYFESTHGERKGLSDTAIKTSKSGHFSRRLVDVAHSMYISETNCKTDEYLEINLKYDRRKFGINYEYAIVNKLSAVDIINKNNEILINKDEIITDKKFEIIISNKIKSVKLRSSLFCKSNKGICAYCYGLDLTTYKLVDIGAPIGILSAQSIGEPGTQLTMRTTHTGGIATTESQELMTTVESFGVLDYSKLIYAVNSAKESIVYKPSTILIVDTETKEILEEIDVKEGSIILKEAGDEVFPGDIITNKSKNVKSIIISTSGIIKYNDMIENVTYTVNVDSDTGIIRKKIIQNLKTFEDYLQPSIIVEDENNKQHKYILEIGMFVVVSNEQKVKVGDIVAKLFATESKTKDITGGLIRIINLFEVKKSTNKSIIATHNGIIKIQDNKLSKKNKVIVIHDKTTNIKLAKFTVSQNKHLLIQDGQDCKCGDVIMDGATYLQDLLDTMGYAYTIKSMMGEISTIYEDQGVCINYKYFEVIIKKMTEYCIVTKQGNTKEKIGTYLTYRKAYSIKMNSKLDENNDFDYKHLIIGITKVALNHYPSFISSSSFQHTISILAHAATHNKSDFMKGIKENVVFGKMMPVGTGYHAHIIK